MVNASQGVTAYSAASRESNDSRRVSLRTRPSRSSTVSLAQIGSRLVVQLKVSRPGVSSVTVEVPGGRLGLLQVAWPA